MLSKQELSKIRSLLEQAQNPLFFYDNDVDGLSSFLLLARFLKRGKGIVIKSYPDLSNTYIRRLHEIKSDAVFILDKPLVDPKFLEACFQLGLPVIWIDHHAPQEKEFVKEVNYFNPLNSSKASSEPVSYLCYQVTKKPEDEWVAMLGCLADYYLPDFAKEFSEKYPDIFPYSNNPAKLLFQSQFGKLVKILSFSLKDRTTNVLKMMKFMLKTNSPYELLNKENKNAEFIYSRFERINKKYTKLIEKAKKQGEKAGRVLFFSYSGDLSISADVSNELLYYFPKKMIVVAYLTGSKANISLRDNKIDLRSFLDKVMQDIEGTHGGHKSACGATIAASDFERFKKNLLETIKSENKIQK
ncbi:hypothetical protein B6U80_02285 [Candidatus Pacearchaeota archaeon ex4484_26]|nr:MAG: hypothetical protein B6U80_02285 [Candidatus Pacearchaeota archaeon ex4484_26]